MSDIYEPREDSFLLGGVVEKLAFGKVIDVGTGSGYLAVVAANNRNVKCVCAVDINPKAVATAMDLAISENIPLEAFQSDLFSNVKDKFDTIIFNPPYLPNDANISDIALDGGKNGYELIERFLVNAKNFLNLGGFILLLFSSLSNKDKVDSILMENGYSFSLEDQLDLDFEKLFVYKVVL